MFDIKSLLTSLILGTQIPGTIVNSVQLSFIPMATICVFSDLVDFKVVGILTLLTVCLDVLCDSDGDEILHQEEEPVSNRLGKEIGFKDFDQRCPYCVSP